MPLTLERLEQRCTPAAFNVPWPEVRELTLSFAPDGTDSGGQSSTLFQALDPRLPTAVWQREVLRAFQTWAVEADVNVGLVADGGQPFGTLGLKQGDPRFGDVRVGAHPMSANVLAVADPYDPFVANTWVGDVVLNSAVPFGVGTTGGSYDLFTVLLHEAGHVFGIGHSPDPSSPMYPQFNQVRTGLTPADAAALRALYGPRQPDAYEGAEGNGTLATATGLSLGGGGAPPAAAEVEADITTHQDADVYAVTVPAGVTGLSVRLTAAGKSLLVPRLTVYDRAGNVVASALASDPLDNNLALRIDGARAGETYYVKVEGGTADVFGIGSYGLEIAPLLPGQTAPPPAASGPAGYPGGASAAGNPLTGAQLLATTPGYVEHTYYEIAGTLSPASPTQTYRVRSADLGPDLTNVMTVVVYAPQPSAARYGVNVYDDRGNPVAANVVTDEAGRYAVQVPNVASDRDYFVQVSSGNLAEVPQAAYAVEADFAQDGAHLETYVNQTLDRGTREFASTLQVLQSQQFHFVLSASDWSAPVETGVRMTISDAGGRVVFTTAVADGATRSMDVLLDPGAYTVRFTRAAEQGADAQPLLFQLKGRTLSDSMGPQLRDTTLGPVESAAAVTPEVTFFWLPYRPGGTLPGAQASGSSPQGGTGALLALPQPALAPGLPFAPGTARSDPAPSGNGPVLPVRPGAVGAPSSVGLFEGLAQFPTLAASSATAAPGGPERSVELSSGQRDPGGITSGSGEVAREGDREPGRAQPDGPGSPVGVAGPEGGEGTETPAAEGGPSIDHAAVPLLRLKGTGYLLWAAGLGSLLLARLLLPAKSLRVFVPKFARALGLSSRRQTPGS
jgi:hypothetical protein